MKDIIVGGKRAEPTEEQNPCNVQIHATSWLDPNVEHTPGLNPGYGWINGCEYPKRNCLIKNLCEDRDYLTQIHSCKDVCPLGNKLK